MLNPPKTKEEAEARRYHGWGLNRLRCAFGIPFGGSERQCFRSPRHGPDGLYCKQHAKMVEAALAAKE